MIQAEAIFDDLRPGHAPEVLAQIGPMSQMLAGAGRVCLDGVFTASVARVR